ncbi:MAG: presqualene diphosphate synthase HpnD [Rhodospirillales bacterium]|jgi:phytoene synthase|nr:presqualene diphosphate synthase HpnD [Rhodospirillales bacterium]MDP6804841.1 presqualene diphosphate synthase HpnD [Rhodospirillales bacterium]
MRGGKLADAQREAVAYVNSVVAGSGSSFYFAMRLLPRDKRAAMFAIYAFCREVDDIADDPGDERDKRARLSAWSDEIARVFSGAPEFPIGYALVDAVARFGLSADDFNSVIAGMEMDAAARLRIADMDELFLYCDRVACAVGRLSNRVFGVDGKAGSHIAEVLGQALQLTNILRDLGEDSLRDRLYLPRELLSECGIRETEPAAVLAAPRLADACTRLADLAETRFDEADRALAKCERDRVRPAIVMMEAYRRILRRLLRRGWRDALKPVHLTAAEKTWIVLRYGLV